MGRRGYSPSPPRGGYERRRRSPSPPRSRYGGSSRGRPVERDLPTSLLVRNLRLDCRPEDLRRPFGQFGPLKDIYLPRDYYSGYGDSAFVVYGDISHAAKARKMMNWKIPGHGSSWVDYAEESQETRHPKSGSVETPIDSSPESYSSYIRYRPRNDSPQSITDDSL